MCMNRAKAGKSNGARLVFICGGYYLRKFDHFAELTNRQNFQVPDVLLEPVTVWSGSRSHSAPTNRTLKH